MVRILFKAGDIRIEDLSRFSQAERHYYQLTSGKMESEIGEFGYHQSLRETNTILFRVRDT